MYVLKGFGTQWSPPTTQTTPHQNSPITSLLHFTQWENSPKHSPQQHCQEVLWGRANNHSREPCRKCDHNSFLPQTCRCRGPATPPQESHPTTIQSFRYISVPCYCLQKGPKTVLILNYRTVKRVRGYAETTARKFSYVLRPLICSIPKTQLEQGISEIPGQE